METVAFRRWGYREFSYIRKTTLPCHSLTCLSRSFTSESRHGESGLPELADRPFDATVLVLPNKSFPRETLLGNKIHDYDTIMFPKAQPFYSNSILVLLPILQFMDRLLNDFSCSMDRYKSKRPLIYSANSFSMADRSCFTW